MPYPVCIPCKRQYKCDKVGVYFVESTGREPYRMWAADRYKCPGCGHEILHGFGNDAIIAKHQDDFEARVIVAKNLGTIVEEVHFETERLHET